LVYRKPFPPGATAFVKSNRGESAWREFAFVIHQPQIAFEAVLSLSIFMQNWNQISASLAESSRKRSLQTSHVGRCG